MSSVGQFGERRTGAEWKTVALHEVAAIERVSIVSKDIRGSELYVGLENITGDGDFINVGSADASAVKSNKFEFSEYHVLFGKLRPYLAKIAAPEFAGICSTDILPIQPGNRLDRRYLLHYLRTPAVVAHSTHHAVGINLPRLSPKMLESFKIPLPPVEEQRRIAMVLDVADALRARRRQTVAKLNSLAQAVFAQMFGDGSEWPVGKLGDLVPTTSGGTPSRSRPDYFEGHIPWVKSGELRVESVTATEEAITDEALSNSSAKLMPIGTVLLAMYGATVGETALLGIEAATNQAICCLSPTESLSGAYLLGLLRSRRNDLIGRAAGGAQPNISQTIVRELEIPLAPIEMQSKYAERIAAIGRLRSVASSSAAVIDTLFASLQQRAFRGEL